jgi:predicted enzyme related to lactoylglutathione lyase
MDNNKHPSWVDITAKDAEASRTFTPSCWAGRFRCSRRSITPSSDFGVVESGSDMLPGGIGQRGDQRPAGIVTYFSVSDVEASLARPRNSAARSRCRRGSPRPRHEAIFL